MKKQKLEKQIQQQIMPIATDISKIEYKQLSDLIQQVGLSNKMLTNTNVVLKKKQIKIATPSVLLLTNNDNDIVYLKNNLFTSQILQKLIIRCIQEYTSYYRQQIHLLFDSCDVLLISINSLIYLKNKNIINLNVLQQLIVFEPQQWNYSQQMQLCQLCKQFQQQNKQQICIVQEEKQILRQDNLNTIFQSNDQKYQYLIQEQQSYLTILQNFQIININYQHEIQLVNKQIESSALSLYLQQINQKTLIVYNKQYVQQNILSQFIYNIAKNDYGVKLQIYRQFMQSNECILLCEQKCVFNMLDKLFDTVIGVNLDQCFYEECKFKAKLQYISLNVLE